MFLIGQMNLLGGESDGAEAPRRFYEDRRARHPWFHRQLREESGLTDPRNHPESNNHLQIALGFFLLTFFAVMLKWNIRSLKF